MYNKYRIWCKIILMGEWFYLCNKRKKPRNIDIKRLTQLLSVSAIIDSPSLYIDRLGHMIWLDSSILNCIGSSTTFEQKIQNTLIILLKIWHYYNKSSWSSGKHGSIQCGWTPIQTLSHILFSNSLFFMFSASKIKFSLSFNTYCKHIL